MQHIASKDGTVISFLRTGTGPPLLLVHGATADYSRWAPISPRFERHFTVYAMDRRGRGESGDTPDYDLMREAEDVAAVVDAIGEPVNVLGHSYGALCCMEGALLTDGVRRLILYEPGLSTDLPLYPPETIDRMQTLIDRGEWEPALEMLFREIVEMPEHEFEAYRRLPSWQVRLQLAPTIPRELMGEQTYRFDPQRVAALQVPTLLLLGGNSPPVARQAIEVIDAALPNSRIVVLPGQTHIAMDSNPGLFVKEVLNFLLPSSTGG